MIALYRRNHAFLCTMLIVILKISCVHSIEKPFDISENQEVKILLNFQDASFSANSNIFYLYNYKTLAACKIVTEIFEEYPSLFERMIDSSYFKLKYKSSFFDPFEGHEDLLALCKSKEKEELAKEHYDKALEALRDALYHSMTAGALIEIPPLAAFEGYRSIGKWKEAAHEYLEGKAIEREEESSAREYPDSRSDSWDRDYK